MSQTIKSQYESLKSTASSGYESIEKSANYPRSESAELRVVYVSFEPKVAKNLPEGYTSIDDLVKEFEQDSLLSGSLEEGRKWVAKQFYSENQTLAALRLKKGFSQAKLARLLGTSQSHVARMESGREDLRLSTISKLAAALEVEESVIIQTLKMQGSYE